MGCMGWIWCLRLSLNYHIVLSKWPQMLTAQARKLVLGAYVEEVLVWLWLWDQTNSARKDDGDDMMLGFSTEQISTWKLIENKVLWLLASSITLYSWLHDCLVISFAVVRFVLISWRVAMGTIERCICSLRTSGSVATIKMCAKCS